MGQISRFFNWLFPCKFNELACRDSLFGCKCGKGGTTIQQAPATPAPAPSETAKDVYAARLQYDPQIARAEYELQQEYVPKQTALYSSLYNQYAPQMAQTQQQVQQQLYPYQSQIVEQGAQQALSRLQNPNYMTTQEQTAQDATRQKAIDALQRSMRERANLGGGLYGGRAAGAEAESVSNLVNQFQVQDYQNRMAASQQAQQALNPYMQILYPQVGTAQPQISPYQFKSAVPGADTLYNAYFQASQPQNFAIPGRQGVSLGPLGQWGMY